jgi:hypothetical protein
MRNARSTLHCKAPTNKLLGVDRSEWIIGACKQRERGFVCTLYLHQNVVLWRGQEDVPSLEQYKSLQRCQPLQIDYFTPVLYCA